MNVLIRFLLYLVLIIIPKSAPAVQMYDSFAPEEFNFWYDSFGENLDKKKIEDIIETYTALENSKSVGPRKSCELYGQRWPCHSVPISVLSHVPIQISDVFPFKGTADSTTNEILKNPGDLNFVIDPPLPPPIPYLAFSPSAKKGERPRFEDERSASSDQSEFIGITSKSILIFHFNYESARQSLRDLLFVNIGDFTMFAPSNKVYGGEQIYRIIAGLSTIPLNEGKCSGVCDFVYLSEQNNIQQYKICIFKKNIPYISAPISCTILAFKYKDTTWLRTRKMYGLSIGRGAGPEEVFSCLSPLDRALAISRFADILRKNDYRVQVSDNTSTKNIIASSVGRKSEIASNRYEIVNLAISVERGVDQTPPTSGSVIRYLVPTYKLSPTKVILELIGDRIAPSSFDGGRTPSLRLARAFEKDLRLKFVSSAPRTVCRETPDEP